ncbi:scamp-domain-containing protein [Calocera cornea HHB12733]|uniref:Scamp-domain-containing protein n=1 Tax=Calocera cornea HHB12733 TaxID=1353952 RepID=A0A165H7Q3_9BASI|nr:scamp-domain-containing protein [Calocera cornea HHB12733]
MSHPVDPFASTTSLDDEGPNPFADPTPTRTTFPSSARSAPANPDARLEELSRRERELEARERDLARQQEALATAGKANWPFFFPFLRHDIKGDIPELSQQLMQRLYLLWLILLGTLIINFVACIFILLSGTADGGKDLGASIGYLVVIPVASFFLWYLPIYRGFAKEQSLFYYIYYIFCGFHLLFSIYMIIGIPSTGSAGLISMISCVSVSFRG